MVRRYRDLENCRCLFSIKKVQFSITEAESDGLTEDQRCRCLSVSSKIFHLPKMLGDNHDSYDDKNDHDNNDTARVQGLQERSFALHLRLSLHGSAAIRARQRRA